MLVTPDRHTAFVEGTSDGAFADAVSRLDPGEITGEDAQQPMRWFASRSLLLGRSGGRLSDFVCSLFALTYSVALGR